MLGEFFSLCSIGFGLSVALMGMVWSVAVRIKNAGIVDIAWAGGFYPLAAIFAFSTSGYPTRRVLIAVMVAVWSLRLATHLYFRVAGKHPQEDGRYAKLRADWGADFDRRLLWFFQLQAGLLVVLSVPFLIACLNTTTALSRIEWLGFLVWLTGVVGEAVADWQLNRFKASPENRGKTCMVGLWRYSRHPNYFFEWLVWVGFFLFALGSPWGWLTIYCPALMLHFLLRVTGIPATEAEALRTKGDEYRRYQATTNQFVPWFPHAPVMASPFAAGAAPTPRPAMARAETVSSEPAPTPAPAQLNAPPSSATSRAPKTAASGTQFHRKPKGPV